MVWPFSKSKSKKSKKKIKKTSSAAKTNPAKAQSKARKIPKAVTTRDKALVEPTASASAPPPARHRTKHEMTPERERLIRTALIVHANQTKVLDEIDDDLKKRLRALAEEKLLGGGETKK